MARDNHDQYSEALDGIRKTLDDLILAGCRRDRIYLAMMHYQKMYRPNYRVGEKDYIIDSKNVER